jgi:hypothetical protein
MDGKKIKTDAIYEQRIHTLRLLYMRVSRIMYNPIIYPMTLLRPTTSRGSKYRGGAGL